LSARFATESLFEAAAEARGQAAGLGFPSSFRTEALICEAFVPASFQLTPVMDVPVAVKVWYHVKQELPQAPDQQIVRVIGQQWAWTFVHAGPDGKLDTPDDITKLNELHVEVDKLYHFQLESKDVIHSFSVPVFRLKQDVIPGRVITGWFTPIKTGSFDIQCTEICGIGHALMPGRITIETPEQHAAWVAENSTLAVASATAR